MLAALQNHGKWTSFTQSQFDLLVSGRLGPRFWGQFLDPKTGAVFGQNLFRRAKNSASFDCFRGCATKVFISAGRSMVLQCREHLFLQPSAARPVFAGVLDPKLVRIAGEKAFGVYDNNQAYRSVVSCFFSSLIAALHAWRMFVCYNACGGHPP